MVAIKHAGHGMQMAERPEQLRRPIGTARQPDLHRAFTLDFPVHPAAQAPEAFLAAGDQVVLRPAQGAVRTESEVEGDSQRGRITSRGAKIQPQHLGVQRRPYPPPPPPPPPPVRGRSCASLTLSGRPPKSLPLSACIAREASALDISTKPKPRGRPVSRSFTSDSFSTVPCSANKARSVSSVAENGRLPT